MKEIIPFSKGLPPPQYLAIFAKFDCLSHFLRTAPETQGLFRKLFFKVLKALALREGDLLIQGIISVRFEF